jgi:protein O-GlcNAc transferase
MKHDNLRPALHELTRLLQRRDLARALILAQQLAANEPADARARTALAQTLRLNGRPDAAREELDAALALAPDSIPGWIELAQLEHDLGRRAEAEAALRELIRLDPVRPQFHLGLGNALRDQSRWAEARDEYTSAVALDPTLRPARLALAQALLAGDTTDPARALAEAQTLLSSVPGDTDAMAIKASALALQGQHLPAIAAWQSLIRARPDQAQAHHELGLLLFEIGEHARSADAFRALTRLQPKSSLAWFFLGKSLLRTLRNDEARDAFERAFTLDPGMLAAAWGRLQCVPLLPFVANEPRRIIEDWLASLSRLEAIDPATPAVAPLLESLLHGPPNFFLHYLDEELVEPQRRYGALIARWAQALHPTPARTPAPRSDDRLRIGFVSAHIRQHTVTRLFRRFISDLDRSRFHVTLVSLGEQGDAWTDAVAATADESLRQPLSFGGWIDELASRDLDALIYLDIGMDTLPQVLASHRLADFQAMFWGHPVTSGSPEMDVFLSAEAMEPEDGQRLYLEELVCLPGIGVCYDPPEEQPDVDWNIPWGEDRDRVVHFVLVQTLFKLSARHDQLLAGIASQLPHARFTLIPDRNPENLEALRARMRPTFAAHGLDMDARVRVHPQVSPTQFLGLLQCADVVLDSVGWSGGNTTLEALWYDLPAVTLPGRSMRSRHTAGMLRMLGLEELVARDAEDYVRIAVSLGRDRERRDAIRHAIATRKGRLYLDAAPVRALEDLLLARAGRSRK